MRDEIIALEKFISFFDLLCERAFVSFIFSSVKNCDTATRFFTACGGNCRAHKAHIKHEQ